MRTASWISIAVGLVILGGCGGSDGNSSTAVVVKTMNKQVYIARANKICAEGEAERQKEFNAAVAQRRGEISGALNTSEIGKLVAKAALPSVQRMVTELEELRLPNGAKQEADEFIASIQVGIRATEENPAGAIENAGFAESREIAEKLGLVKCAL
jgi:hypothetical protein